MRGITVYGIKFVIIEILCVINGSRVIDPRKIDPRKIDPGLLTNRIIGPWNIGPRKIVTIKNNLIGAIPIIQFIIIFK